VRRFISSTLLKNEDEDEDEDEFEDEDENKVEVEDGVVNENND
jgi:hypothetical protein